jgi:hypothetical protein
MLLQDKSNFNETDLCLALDEIRALLPAFTEKRSYGAYYFFHKKALCFLWPYWVKGAPIKEGFHLGFCHANKLHNHYPELEMGTRKQVGLIHFTHYKKGIFTPFQDLIKEAWEINELEK